MDAAFRRDFGTTPNAVLAVRYEVSARTIARWASRAGLKKSKAYRQQLASRISRTRDPSSRPRGPAHWNWKGGRPWERFRDPRYRDWRTAVLERDGYRCQLCGRQCARYERGLAAHHVEEWATTPARRFDPDNGLTLCRDCHMRLHGHAPKPVPTIACACGCGAQIAARDRYGRPRRFVNGHGRRGRSMSASGRAKLSTQRRGKSLTAAHRAKISAGLRASTKRIGRPPTSAVAQRSS